MSEPFLAEVRIVGFNFAPRGWAFCHGQILPINQNQSLYSLLGTTYGGDGRTSFALPDLRGRTPIHVGNNGEGSHQLGQRSGEECGTRAVASAHGRSHKHNYLNGLRLPRLFYVRFRITVDYQSQSDNIDSSGSGCL